MALCKTTLPESFVKELQRIIERVAADDINFFVKNNKSFQSGGFRPGKTGVIRTRLLQQACGQSIISEDLRVLISTGARTSSLTALLIPEVLHDLRHALATVLGREGFILALLLDAREEVRNLAEQWLASPEYIEEVAAEDAQVLLRNVFADMVELTGASASSDGHVLTRETWQAQKVRLEGKLRESAAENRRLKGVDERLAQAGHKYQKLESEFAVVQEKLSEQTRTVTQQTRKLEQVEAELRREVTERDERVKTALDAVLAKELFGWLGSAQNMEKQTKSAKDKLADLSKRVTLALDKQAELDRHFGNIQVLQHKLNELELLETKVGEALCHAIKQAPGLKEIYAEIVAEIERIKRILNRENTAPPLEQNLVKCIHTLPDNELPKFRETLVTLGSLGIFTQVSQKRITESLNKRLAAISMTGTIPEPESPPVKTSAELARLSRALSGQAAAMLLIDGHNAIFGMPSRYAPARGKALTESEKREMFITDIVRIAQPNPGLQVCIVFDGPERSDANAAINVRITYSGGTGEHRADKVIIEKLRFYKKHDPELTCFMVSNDKDLCRTATKLGAQPIAVLDFGAYL